MTRFENVYRINNRDYEIVRLIHKRKQRVRSCDSCIQHTRYGIALLTRLTHRTSNMYPDARDILVRLLQKT